MFNFKKVTAVAAAFVLSLSAVAFVGCGATKSGNKFVGTWHLSQIVQNGQARTPAEFVDYLSQNSGLPISAELQSSLVFRDDGTGNYYYSFLDNYETAFTYTESGNTATAIMSMVDGEEPSETVFTYDNEKGVISISDPTTGDGSIFTK